MSAAVSADVTRADLQAVVDWWRTTAPRSQTDWLERGPPNEIQARRAVDQMIARQNRIVAQMTAKLRTKKLSASDFETAMALEVKRGHLAAAALARGGIDRLTMADLADIEGRDDVA